MTVDLQAQILAQMGAVVMKLDNRGSYYRGKRFEAAIHRALGTLELSDQLKGVAVVGDRFGIDISNVGIYGWSYGGFMTLTALTRAPETFRVGVSGAPVTDWRLYNCAYTERYMGTLNENSEGYERSRIASVPLDRDAKLLVIHGMIDENVHFNHTAVLMESLLEDSSNVELCLLPSCRHSLRLERYLRESARRRTEYFAHHFNLVPPAS
jgi:dipeptidyl-peptidase-4